MPVEVTGPDGLKYHFPDGTTKDAAVSYFKKKGIGAKPTSAFDVARGAAKGIAEGVGFDVNTPAARPGDVLVNTAKQFGHGLGGLVGRASQPFESLSPQNPLKTVGTALNLFPAFLMQTAETLDTTSHEAAKARQGKDWATFVEKEAQGLTNVALLRGAKPEAELSPVGKLRKTAAEVAPKSAEAVAPVTNIDTLAMREALAKNGGQWYSGAGEDANKIKVRMQNEAKAAETAKTQPQEEESDAEFSRRTGQAQGAYDIKAEAQPRSKPVPTAAELKKTLGDRLRSGAQSVLGADSRLTEEAVEASNKKLAEDKATAAEKNKAIRSKADTENVEAVEKTRAKRAEVEAKNKEATEKHAKETQRIKELNRGAEETLALRRGTETQLKERTERAFALEDQVKAKVKAANDSNWNEWREKVGEKTEVDMGPVLDTIERVTAKFPEVKEILSQTAPSEDDLAADNRQFVVDRRSVMKDQGYRGEYEQLPPDAKAAVDRTMDKLGLKPGDATAIDVNKPMTIKQVHDLKTQVGWKVFRNEYPPNIHGAMKQVLKSLEQAEVRTSVAQKALPELEKARSSHQEFQEAFGRSRPKRAMEGELRKKEANPDVYSEQEEQKRIEAVAKHDPGLAKEYKELADLRQKVSEFPKEESLRKGLKPLPEAPKLAEVPEVQRRVPPEYTSEAVEPARQEPVAVSELKRQQMIKNSRAARGWTRYDSQVLALSAVGPFLGEWKALLIEPALLAARKGVVRILDTKAVRNWMVKPTVNDIAALEKLTEGARESVQRNMTDFAVKEAKPGQPVDMAPEVRKFLGPANVAKILAASGAQQGQIKNRRDAMTALGHPAP